MWERFAIRHTPSGKYLPERWRKGRGYSHDEPSYDFPRLFPSEASARAALTAWLQGKWSRGWSIDYNNSTLGLQPDEVETLDVEEAKGRNRDEMEIVRCRVERIS